MATAIYKDFEIIDPNTPEPWGDIDENLQKDIIDTVTSDCVVNGKDVGGHKHANFYDETATRVIQGLSGVAVISSANITAGLTISTFTSDGIVHNSGGGFLSSSLIANADIADSAAISWSKINSGNAIMNADISPTADIAWSKIYTVGAIPRTSSVMKGDGAGGFASCSILDDITYLTTATFAGVDLDTVFSSGTYGFLKKTGTSAYTLDTNYYLTEITGDELDFVFDALSAGFLMKVSEGTYTVSASSVAPHALLSASHNDSVTHAVVRGDLVVGNSTPAWERLPKGTNGSLLTCNATDTAWSVQTFNLDYLSNIAALNYVTDTVLVSSASTYSLSKITNNHIAAAAQIALSKLQGMNSNTIVANIAGNGNSPTAITKDDLHTLAQYYISGDSPLFSALTVTSASDSEVVFNCGSANKVDLIFQKNAVDQWKITSSNNSTFHITYPGPGNSFDAFASFYSGVDHYAGILTISGGIILSGNGLQIHGTTLRLDTMRLIIQGTTVGNAGEICWYQGTAGTKVHLYICTGHNGGTEWGDFTSANLT